MLQKQQLCFLLLFVVCCLASDEECKCSNLPIGKWDVHFSRTVVPGYRTDGHLVMKHRYNEVFYGMLKLYGYLPLQWFPMEFAGYLNGTSCKFRGSLAFVPARLTVVFDLDYDNDKTMEGHYNRATAISVDDHFDHMEVKLVDPEYEEEDEEFEFDGRENVAVV